jgi:hypothetical protein
MLTCCQGELTFGGVDTSKTTGTVKYVPVTKSSPASKYWGIDQSITYGSKQILKGSGIVDTGTTLVLLSTCALFLSCIYILSKVPTEATTSNSSLQYLQVSHWGCDG